MATVLTATQVISDFGAYYIDSGQNQGNIHNKIIQGFDSKEAFTVIETEDTVLREANTAFSEALQSFQKAFTPKGGVVFTPQPITLYNVKVDESFYPDDLKNSWLQFLTSNVLDRTQWPFVRWFIEEYVLKQIMSDIELKAIYKGIYLAPTPGTANNAVDTMNGVKKLINDAVTAASITTIATGTPSSTNATWLGQVEAFIDSIPELYRTQVMQLNMSKVNAVKYVRGRRAAYNLYWEQASNMNVIEDYDNISIVGRPSMIGSSKIWATPKQNAILALKGGSNQQIVEVEKVDRMVKVYTDFWIGVGFIDPSIVFTNDRDLVNGTLSLS